MRYVFDLDGTLFSIKPFITALNAYTGKKLKLMDITEYDLYNVYGLDKEDEATVAFFNHMLLRSYPKQLPNCKMQTLMNFWKSKNIEFSFVTARPDSAYDATLKSLTTYFGTPSSIYMNCKDKTRALLSLHGDRYFEDSPYDLLRAHDNKKVREQYEITKIAAPYNELYPADSSLYFRTKNDYTH